MAKNNNDLYKYISEKNMESLNNYLQEKAENHNSYKWYTNVDIIDNSLRYKSLFLSAGDDWNDVNDKERFNNPKEMKKCFARCFSFSISENVAMWMLYGGTEKKGAMLEIKKSFIKSVLEYKDEINVGYFESDDFVTVKTYNSDEYDLYIQDVIYVGKSKKKGCVTLKRSDDRCDEISKKIVDFLPLWKSYPWQYENECRLILKVKDNNMSDKTTDAQIIVEKVMEREIIKKTLSPNYSGNKREGYDYSLLKDELNWDICRNCKKNE